MLHLQRLFIVWQPSKKISISRWRGNAALWTTHQHLYAQPQLMAFCEVLYTTLSLFLFVNVNLSGLFILFTYTGIYICSLKKETSLPFSNFQHMRNVTTV